MEILAIILFISIFLLILYGYPVSLTLGGLSILYALCFIDLGNFAMLPLRVLGVMDNFVLLAVPLFVFMGIMLERSGLAENLLETMGALFGKIPGGIAISTIIVGGLLAASTGIVGATVITMGLISLPTMLKKGYSKELATGAIASAGTLGQIIPPSIVLVLLGSVLNVSVGSLFAAALLPGLGLVGAYILYIIIVSQINPALAPPLPDEELKALKSDGYVKRLISAFFMPLILIIAVLGSIFLGLASPTESAAIGALGATLLTIFQGAFSWKILREVAEETTHITSMVFLILLGATTFSFVFRELGGDTFLVEAIQQAGLSATGFLIVVMVVVFVAGFFIDFIEIVFIIVPVVAPIFANTYDVNLIWIGILLALNLQTSFLTPPFGFSLFYLKGVAPSSVTTAHLYRGIVPFVAVQLLFLMLIILFPDLLF